MSQNSLVTSIETMDANSNFINIATYSQTPKNAESEIVNNDIAYESINSQTLEFLFLNHETMSPDKIELLINSFVINQINFYEIVKVFLDRPDSILLDLAKSCLIRFEEIEFQIVISYLKNNSINDYVKAYFIETIVIWDLINKQTRENELNNVLNSESNDFLKEILQDAIRDITE